MNYEQYIDLYPIRIYIVAHLVSAVKRADS